MAEEKKKMTWREFFKFMAIIFLAGAMMAAGSRTVFALWPKKNLITVEHIIKSVDGKILSRTSTTTEEA